MEARPRCYIASPLGFTEAGRHYYSEVYLPALAEIVTVVDPWSLTSDAEVAEMRAMGTDAELALLHGRRNADAVRSCALLAALLDGQELDSGTAAEVGFAAGLGLRCYGLRTDLREHGETGAVVNLQVETFIVDSGGRVSTSLRELVQDLRAVSLDTAAAYPSRP
jgi:nucleoside 2-deoxyribosyltransferase